MNKTEETSMWNDVRRVVDLIDTVHMYETYEEIWY